MKYASEKELAHILGKNRMTIAAWRKKGFIQPIDDNGKDGQSKRYLYDVEQVFRAVHK